MANSRQHAQMLFKVGIGVGIMALGAIAWSTISAGSGPVELGTAALQFGDQPARSVETVEYGRDVARVADLIVTNGQPDQVVSDAQLAAVWSQVDQIWPDSLRASLTQLSLFEGEPRGLVGVVHHSVVTDGWILSLDLADVADESLINETIVHELAHIVNFDAATFELGQTEDCVGVLVELGCAGPDDLISRYAAVFWPDGEVLDDDDSSFATNYSRENVTEDIAETLVAWTFGWPVEPGSGLADKIAYIAGEPVLASLHDELVELIAERSFSSRD